MKTKKILVMLAIALSLGSHAQTSCGRCSTTPVLSDSLNNPLQDTLIWTNYDPDKSNGRINFNSGKINYVAFENPVNPNILGLSDSRDTRVYRSIGTTLSNSGWKAECTINVSGGNAPGHAIMALTAGTQAPTSSFNTITAAANACTFGSGCLPALATTNQDAVMAFLGYTQTPNSYNGEPFSSTTWYFLAQGKHGTVSSAASSPIYLPALNTNYTVILERLSPSSCLLTVLNTSTGLNVLGSPQCFSIDPNTSGLNTLQSGTNAGGSWYRSLACTIDNFDIYSCDSLALTATALPKTVCAGSPATLCAFGSGCTSYTWQPGNFSGQTVVVTPTVTTTYTVTASCPCSFKTTVTVSVTPGANYSADFTSSTGILNSSNNYTISCTAATSNAFITGSGGGYAWTVEQVTSSNALIPGTLMMNPANWINNNASITFPGYCCNPTVIVGNGTFAANNDYKITRYVWGNCEALTSVSYYFKKCTNCKVGSIEVTGPYYNDQNNMLTGISSASSSPTSIKLYPNPADKTIQLNLEGNGTKKIEVYDTNGKMVLESNSAENIISINVENQSAGMYFVKVTSENQTFQIIKFIKQ